MFTSLIQNGIIIISFIHNTENNTIEVIKRQPSNSMYACNPPIPTPDKVWKEIYHVIDGKIELKETIEGKHEPAYFKHENIIF